MKNGFIKEIIILFSIFIITIIITIITPFIFVIAACFDGYIIIKKLILEKEIEPQKDKYFKFL